VETEEGGVSTDNTRRRTPATEAFIADIVSVYRKHGLSIGHEDNHGAFEIDDYHEVNVDWLQNAFNESSK
jgi:hypothetical protein